MAKLSAPPCRRWGLRTLELRRGLMVLYDPGARRGLLLRVRGQPAVAGAAEAPVLPRLCSTEILLDHVNNCGYTAPQHTLSTVLAPAGYSLDRAKPEPAGG